MSNTNAVLKTTIDMLRTTISSSRIKTKRNFTDFIADRLVQATAEPTLLSAVEKLSGLIDSSPGETYQPVLVEFLKTATSPQSHSALAWLREYPRIAAMLVMLKKDDYLSAISEIEPPDSAKETGAAIPPPDPEIKITATCLSPLAHGSDTKAGNATLFRRMQVLSTTGAVLALPFFAGNALRGTLRDILADDLITALGLTPRRPLVLPRTLRRRRARREQRSSQEPQKRTRRRRRCKGPGHTRISRDEQYGIACYY